MPNTYRLGQLEFDVESGDLRRDDAVVRLSHQPASLLAALLERNGGVMSRSEIAARLWPDDVHVDTEAGINFVVRQLRVALGDDASAPKFLETLPRRGYRLIAPIENAGHLPLATAPSRPRPAVRVAVASAMIAAGIAWLVVIAAPRPAPLRLLVQFGTDAAGARHFDREGLRDLLIADLTGPGSRFEVIAPQVADTYLTRPFPDARAELSLDLLLHVSVQDADGVPRLHAKLVRAADGVILWSENRDHAAGALRRHGRSVAADLAGHVVRAAS